MKTTSSPTKPKVIPVRFSSRTVDSVKAVKAQFMDGSGDSEVLRLAADVIAFWSLRPASRTEPRDASRPTARETGPT